ncbi:MAG: RNA polymerase sigma factor [Elusimicrobiota bacterium]
MSSRSKLVAHLAKTMNGRAPSAARAFNGNLQDAREFVRQGLYRAVLNWQRFDKGRRAEPWFIAILRNAARDWRKRAHRRLTVPLDDPAPDSTPMIDLIADDCRTPLQELERSETRRLVRDALGELRRDHRRVLKLCGLDGLSYRQAAKRLRVPVGTIRSRLFRARAAFRLEWTAAQGPADASK